MIDLTPDEQEYVFKVLQSAHTELLRNLHHADSRDFRQTLKTVIDLNERITGKVICEIPASRESGEMRQQSEDN